jgi:hypothetical protein
MPPTTRIKTITPDRDGWYWAIRSAWPELPGLLELVRVVHGRVWIAGNEVEDRPEDWRFYAGPIEPPKLDLAVTGRSAGRTARFTDQLSRFVES